MNILFIDNQLGLRGTTVALYDYAYYNKILLNNNSFIGYMNNNPDNNNEVIDKFTKEFDVFVMDKDITLDKIIRDNKIDIAFIMKYGLIDSVCSNLCKTCIQCVFDCSERHGNVYMALSEYVKGYKKEYPVMPHMINIPDVLGDMRKELDIPEDAVVFGRHGGYEQFDIEYVRRTVREVAEKHREIYFLFVNTLPLDGYSLPNVIYLSQIVDMNDKRRFINTCDGMIWGRSDGETFGLAIGEFSICNKPVIATDCGYRAHVNILGDKGIWYSNEEELREILVGFDKEYYKNRDNNAFREYTPEKVMDIFKRICIDNNIIS